MEKVKESVQTAEDVKAQVKEMLGLEENLGEEIIKELDSNFLKIGEEHGEERAKEALDLACKAMSMIKDAEIQGILVVNCLSRLPVLLQKSVMKGQQQLIVASVMERLKKNTEVDPMAGMFLMAAAIKAMKENED